MFDVVTQVYVVTSGEYSDYGISSVWLTLEQAKEEAGTWGQVEVWPVGKNKRTLGSFVRSCQINYMTCKQSEYSANDYPDIERERVQVLCWPGRGGFIQHELGIRVTADSQERADKVFSEVRARVLAEISQGLPIEAIADSKLTCVGWEPTERKEQEV